MVLDGRNAPIQVIGMVNFPKSVNPKTFSQGNTEPSVKACVETGRETSVVDEGTVRTLQKCNELHRNSAVARKGSNKIDYINHRWHYRFCTHGKNLPAVSVMGLMHFPNSVNPKLFEHGNTEPSMGYWPKACVENVQEASFWMKIRSEHCGNAVNQPEMS